MGINHFYEIKSILNNYFIIIKLILLIIKKKKNIKSNFETYFILLNISKSDTFNRKLKIS